MINLVQELLDISKTPLRFSWSSHSFEEKCSSIIREAARVTLNSHEWLIQTFFSQYQYNIKQMSDMMKTQKNINKGIISWMNTKFSEPTL